MCTQQTKERRRKLRNLLFIDTNTFCGFLFIFKLLPLFFSFGVRLRRFLLPVALQQRKNKSFAIYLSMSPSSPAVIRSSKTHEEHRKNAGWVCTTQRRLLWHTMKNLRLLHFSLFSSARGEFSNLIYYRTMFISHSGARRREWKEWNSPFKYKSAPSTSSSTITARRRRLRRRQLCAGALVVRVYKFII